MSVFDFTTEGTEEIKYLSVSSVVDIKQAHDYKLIDIYGWTEIIG